jgi:demethylmenaquinone methyltransferase/2-methoxy-6-polyprenyl-1,4-benzoquinol methylase
MSTPSGVEQARHRAREHGFDHSCEPPTGELLAALAAAVPAGGRVLELGTGAGVGLAWIVHGLSGRDDVSVVSVEQDPGTARVAAAGDWPSWVRIVTGDAVALLPGLGTFDLVFADAEGGKWTRLDLSVAALLPGGQLLLDDLDPARHELPERRATVAGIRAALRDDVELTVVELAVGTGLLIAAKLRGPAVKAS